MRARRYGGLRRSEVVRLNIGDYQPQFGLRRVLGKGGHEGTVPLPEVARTIISEYLAKDRPGAAASEPLFLVRYWWYGGERKTRRISGQRIWKIIKDLGKRVGVDTIHPHAFRHACGVELGTVASRSKESGERVAREFGIARVRESW